jgi:hypothetical protein
MDFTFSVDLSTVYANTACHHELSQLSKNVLQTAQTTSYSDYYRSKVTRVCQTHLDKYAGPDNIKQQDISRRVQCRHQ